MLFNSLEFLLFFITFFFLYWKVFRRLKGQNLLILISSAFFYGWWNWHFLFLLFFSITLDYITGLKIAQAKENSKRKFWLWLSITINLGFLGLFKYYNFFITSFADALSNIGFKAHIQTLNIILPVGISFYTFHGLSYVIDIYKRRISAEKNYVDYAVFVSFFPLLVAGPIERATHLLPQIKKNRFFNPVQATDGIKQILWGLFKKIVIADTCADYVNHIFENYQHLDSGLTLILGAVFFAFQIYGDFSGYSDIAIGTAKLLGIELLKNFSFPYFSRDIAEFWRRWHISLSSWFRDYLYIPLGGSKNGKLKTIRNVFIIFIVSGFWHGANWTFIAWGFLNALFIMPSVIFNTNRNNLDTVAQNSFFPTVKETAQLFITFFLTCLAWIFFRSATITDALQYIYLIFTHSWLNFEKAHLKILLLLFVFITVEWRQRQQPIVLKTTIKKKWQRHLLYYIVAMAVWFFIAKNQKTDFIYFAF